MQTPTNDQPIKLGDVITEPTTTYTGTVIGILRYLSGEVRVILQAKAKDGNTMVPDQDFSWTFLTTAPKPDKPEYLGLDLEDTITGFKGVATYAYDMLTGCTGVGLLPRGLDKDGSPHKHKQFDEFRVWPNSTQSAKKTPGPVETTSTIAAH